MTDHVKNRAIDIDDGGFVRNVLRHLYHWICWHAFRKTL